MTQFGFQWFPCGCNHYICTSLQELDKKTSHNQSSDRQRGVALDCLGYLFKISGVSLLILRHERPQPHFTVFFFTVDHVEGIEICTMGALYQRATDGVEGAEGVFAGAGNLVYCWCK